YLKYALPQFSTLNNPCQCVTPDVPTWCAGSPSHNLYLHVVLCVQNGYLNVFDYGRQSELSAEIQIRCRRYPRLVWASHHSYGIEYGRGLRNCQGTIFYTDYFLIGA